MYLNQITKHIIDITLPDKVPTRVLNLLHDAEVDGDPDDAHDAQDHKHDTGINISIYDISGIGH